MLNPNTEEPVVMKLLIKDAEETERIEKQKSETAKREMEIRERLKMSRVAERQSATQE